ncbi:hypothetical protein GW17_00018894 [Ensete ventricosum]|nr:hypothetical protein GW17_00018894 [Ensete ventricosum]
MDDCSGTATTVAQAIAAALDWSSPPDARKAAVDYLESVSISELTLRNFLFLNLINHGCCSSSRVVFLKFSSRCDSLYCSWFMLVMLEYYQHVKFGLHFQALLFWLAIMREPLSKAKGGGQIGRDNSAVGNSGVCSRPTEKEKKGVSAFINDDICAAILDISFQRMLKKNPSATNISTSKAFELWDDEFDSRTDFSQYRSRLVQLFLIQLTWCIM